MIKKLLLVSSVFCAGFASAQTFQIMDHYDVSIEGMSHYENGSTMYLSETKFHIKNLTGSTATYTAKVYEMVNPKSSDLQVCYGTNCFTADDNTPGAQTNSGSVALSGGQIDSTFKVAPFTFTWGTGDSARWRVTVFNLSNPNDSSSAIITWKEGVTSIEAITKEDVKVSAFPNPVSDLLTINYNIKDWSDNDRARIELFDVVGKKMDVIALNKSKGQLKLDVNRFNSGVYFYTVSVNGQALKTERVIIK